MSQVVFSHSAIGIIRVYMTSPFALLSVRHIGFQQEISSFKKISIEVQGVWGLLYVCVTVGYCWPSCVALEAPLSTAPLRIFKHVFEFVWSGFAIAREDIQDKLDCLALITNSNEARHNLIEVGHDTVARSRAALKATQLDFKHAALTCVAAWRIFLDVMARSGSSKSMQERLFKLL